MIAEDAAVAFIGTYGSSADGLRLFVSPAAADAEGGVSMATALLIAFMCRWKSDPLFEAEMFDWFDDNLDVCSEIIGSPVTTARFAVN
jgi:hypothetical protein